MTRKKRKVSTATKKKLSDLAKKRKRGRHGYFLKEKAKGRGRAKK